MKMRMMMLLTTLTTLTACDVVNDKTSAERANLSYQTAMADFTAGRLDAAVDGFNKTIRMAPGNASARFQLAGLLQDRKQDYLGAIAEYREYLRLEPDSDKAQLARERLDICKTELAPVLAKEKKLISSDYNIKEVEQLRRSIADLVKENNAVKTDLDGARLRIKTLQVENNRFKKLLDEALPKDSTKAPDKVDTKSLIDDDEEDRFDRLKFSETVKDLRIQGDDEVATTPFGLTAKRDRTKDNQGSNNKEKHPDTYIVQEGDTLYKLAIRFYGSSSAWIKIREANKAIISMDGRIRAGQKLVLP